ncbi:MULTISPECIES: aldo/keto reductase [unclassified Isoptericola]|uniref:aldo/keto reductase n=1 Tax=unclassified Isoptericola TaxID=2623355 RepID=UPI00271224BF|nr:MULTISPECIES: aldo/keto reductase [unclassified Isoptericola]MDO8145001.1 aldo/keto reductase [Isoptericola sp. 178]MDO8148634.1 aldo/keto reductase [Isoptericola sp. b515]MDO8151420.1 aldo/keto reductase [Isoptericola sp. b408]
MERRQVGGSGLHVSALGLGTMSWGRDTDADDAAQILRAFLDAGGSLVDTAAAYGDGDAEQMLGDLLDGPVAREELVIATKAGVRHGPEGTRRDASRGGLLGELDASLQRLGTDHVDLFLVACPDPVTPLEETVSALRLAVTSGRARYVGLSNFPAWASARAATLLESTDGIGLAALQLEYSLLQRGLEREVGPAAAALGLGLLAWSPLGRGVLTGKYRRSVPADSRGASNRLAGFVEPYVEDAGAASVVEAVATAADGLGRAPLEVALAWLLARPQVASAIVGARTPVHLRGATGAVDLDLPAEVHGALDDVSGLSLGYPERW